MGLPEEEKSKRITKVGIVLKFKTIGKWRPARMLLRGYTKRIEYVQERIAKDVAVQFLNVLRAKAPVGPQYKSYIDSLKIVKLEGKGSVAYAVVSDRKKVRLGEFGPQRSKNIVVYVHAKAGGHMSPALDALIQHNPWTIETLPNFVNRKSSVLIHRNVTKGEAQATRQRIHKVIADNRSDFAQLGIRWGKIEEGETSAYEMESLPDHMADALRAEFGLMAKAHPHWRPTLRYIVGKVKQIIDDDPMIHGALYDALFKEHTLATKEKDVWTAQQFKKEASQFQKAVSGG